MVMSHLISDFCEEDTEQGPRDLALPGLMLPGRWPCTHSLNLGRSRLSHLTWDSMSKNEMIFKLGIHKF